jgi:ABC transporter with metal-binding/Fe-S-binding domain ATP-binding protein
LEGLSGCGGEKMRMAALFSGGKDSTFAVFKAVKEGNIVVKLVSIRPENPDSYMFHHPNIELAEVQADLMGIPIVMKGSVGEKEKELKDLEDALKGLDVEGVCAGALASKYQSDRIEGIAGKLGLKVYSPLWGSDPLEYWKGLLREGFRVIITKVACEGLGKEWLGKEITPQVLEDLKELADRYKFHLGGEGGEFETFVLDCPLFRKSIIIEDSEVKWEGDSGVFVIKRVSTG